MKDAARLRFFRSRFDQYVSDGDAAVADDLHLTVWAALKEFRSDAEIGKMRSDPASVRYEMAFHLWCAAYTGRLNQAQNEVLLSMVRALVVEESAFSLVLAQKSQGRSASAFEDAIKFEQARNAIEWLQNEVSSGLKLESAVAEATKRFGLSRSKIMQYWSIREKLTKASKYAETVRSLMQEEDDAD